MLCIFLDNAVADISFVQDNSEMQLIDSPAVKLHVYQQFCISTAAQLKGDVVNSPPATQLKDNGSGSLPATQLKDDGSDSPPQLILSASSCQSKPLDPYALTHEEQCEIEVIPAIYHQLQALITCNRNAPPCRRLA
jgi:hypothetical protein